jgi:hypothetical protein
VGTSKITGGGDKFRTISLYAAVHLGHMLRALTKKKFVDFPPPKTFVSLHQLFRDGFLVVVEDKYFGVTRPL